MTLSDAENSDDNREVKTYDPTAKASKSILKTAKDTKLTGKRSVVFSDPRFDDNKEESILDEGESDNDEDEELSSNGEDDYDDPEEDNDIDMDESDSDDENKKTVSLKRKRDEEQEPELKEDIYGRLRDAQGNVVPTNRTGTYIPPAKRAMLAGGQNEALRKKLKGLVNK